MTLGVLLLLLPAPGPGIEVVSAGVFARQDEIAARFFDACYLGEYRYWERDAEGNLLREEACRRRSYHKRPGRRRIEFLGVSVNGKELAGPGREQQIAALRRKGLVQDEAEMPFWPETREAYRYEILGPDTCLGRAAWLVGFTPVKRTMQAVVGRAFVDRANFDILRLEFRPARLPRFCVGAQMRLHYAPQQGYMFPEWFEMDMEIRVRFLVTLAHRRLRVEDRYSDYRFNTGLADSLFE